MITRLSRDYPNIDCFNGEIDIGEVIIMCFYATINILKRIVLKLYIDHNAFAMMTDNKDQD